MSEDNKPDLAKDLETVSISVRGRTEEYYNVMEKAEKTNTCPFCNLDNHKNTPLREGKYWTIKFNDFPYKHHLFHFVIIFTGKHTNDISEVPTQA